jgi:hypothetical protein
MSRLALILVLASTFILGQGTSASCGTREYHQLDFWIGTWDVFEVDGSHPVAHASISRELDGCAVHERYEQSDGLHGESFSAYEAGRRQWRQSWYTNHGKGLEMTGTMQADSLVLQGIDYSGTPQSEVRVTWKPLKGSVQETAVISTDNGKTWKTWFDLVFRPSPGSAGMRPGSNDSIWFSDMYTRAPNTRRYVFDAEGTNTMETR